MIPLLLGAGRMLLAGAAKNAAKGAIGKTVKDKAMDAAKDKVVSFAKDKAKERKKRISTKKLFAKTKSGGNKMKKGGGLILRQSSAIVKKSKGALVKTTDQKKGEDNGKGGAIVKSSNIREEILRELDTIKIKVVKIKEISAEKLLNQKQDDKQRYLEGRKKKSEEQEKNLESKKDTKKKKKLGIKAPKLGFFDMIKNYLLNVLMGTLVVFLLKQAPLIIKMFTDIGKGLTNVWQALRLGIITLTTVFPRQIRTIASFTRKIIGPPARLIGRLLLKAGGVAGTLFKKAGGIIFNLIKGPLKSLVKKVGGEALEKGAKGFAKGVANRAGDLAKRGVGRLATRATLAVGGKSLVKRLATLSKIFKRVPIIGSLIGIGIDLALGEKLDRALAGAAGAALGAAIGGALGKGGALALTLSTGGIGVLAAPFIIGASGFLGSAIGDWAGKAIYDNLNKKVPEADKENPVERRIFGGAVNIIKGVGSRIFSRPSAGVQRKTTSTSGLSKQTLEKAKGTILKDEESVKRFGNLSSAYGAIPFVGEAMKLGLDISLGERVSKARTDAIAESIGSTIGMALKNDEFSVRGFNKRIVGEFSRNLTTWAKRKIFISVKSQENQFKFLQEKKKEEERKATGDGTGQPGETDGGGVSTLESAGSLKGLSDSDWNELAYIVSAEAASGDDEYGVAAAVLNRVASPAWPNTIKAVGRQQGQFEAVYTGKARYDKKLAEKLKNNQGKIAAALSKLNGRDSFKGQSMLAYKGPGDVMFQSNGNFFHYRQQQNKSDPAPQNPDQSWKKWISSAGGGNGIKRHKVPFLAMGGNHVVTSSMGLRNFALSPGMHMGVDIAGTRGEPLQAFTDGTVEAAGYDGGYGNWVNWIDNKGIGHFYGHMDKPAYVRGGQKIKKGTILGPLGNTGKSSGPHLHWEAATNPRDNGAPKSSVLSRFNPLSKYNKESPFGGSIQPDPSSASSDIASSSPGSSDSSTPKPEQSEFVKNFKVLGDPAANKGGRGGGSGIDLWGISPSRNSKLGKNSGFGDVPAHHRSYTTEAGLPRDYAVVKSGVNPVANPSAGRGENVVAGVSGKVTFAGFAGGAGNHVVISSGGKEIIRLLHLDKILARNGQSVNPSTVIGTQGNSGTRDIHVHVDGSQAVHTNWIKAMLGGQYESNPSAGSAGSGGTGASSGSGTQPESPRPEQSEFVKNFKVLGDPSIKKSTDEISQTPSYNKSGNSIILMQSPGGGQSPPMRSRSGGNGSGIISVGGMVNSYGMVSKQIISSSLYKL